MNIKKIQELTGFSYSTISRVLNGKAKEFRISKKTSQKIIEVAKLLNYRPNILARSLRLKKTMTIGLIVSDIRNPFFGEFASCIEKLLHEHGYSTILCNTSEISDNEDLYLEVLEGRQVDGIIIAPIHMEEWPHIKSLRNYQHLILIDRIFRTTDLPWVTSENMQAAEAMTDEMIRLGYKRIAFLGGTLNTYINEVRYKGFQNSFLKHSLMVDESLVSFTGYSAEAGEEMLETLWSKRNDIEAVFCVNNLVFFGALKVVNRIEAETRRRLLMSAFDTGRYSSLLQHPQIIANQDLAKLAECSVSLLLDRIHDRPLENHQIVLPISIEQYFIGGGPRTH